jgi:hypothetical protein
LGFFSTRQYFFGFGILLGDRPGLEQRAGRRIGRLLAKRRWFRAFSARWRRRHRVAFDRDSDRDAGGLPGPQELLHDAFEARLQDAPLGRRRRRREGMQEAVVVGGGLRPIPPIPVFEAPNDAVKAQAGQILCVQPVEIDQRGLLAS